MSRVKRAAKPKRGRPVGSGSKLAEATVLVSAPAVMLAAVTHAAQLEGISVREWWRRAARGRLGWTQSVEQRGGLTVRADAPRCAHCGDKSPAVHSCRACQGTGLASLDDVRDDA